MAFAGNLAAVLFAPKKASKFLIKSIRNLGEKSSIISVVNIYPCQNNQRTFFTLIMKQATSNFRGNHLKDIEKTGIMHI